MDELGKGLKALSQYKNSFYAIIVYEWIGYTISDNSATVDCGNQSGPGAITMHSHTYLESGGSKVKDAMGILHSPKDLTTFGGLPTGLKHRMWFSQGKWKRLRLESGGRMKNLKN